MQLNVIILTHSLHLDNFLYHRVPFVDIPVVLVVVNLSKGSPNLITDLYRQFQEGEPFGAVGGGRTLELGYPVTTEVGVRKVFRLRELSLD